MSTKINFPAFVKLNTWMSDKDGKSYRLKLRINPTSISSYMESPIKDESGNVKEAVVIYVGGNSFMVDLSISDADKMMDEIERDYTIDE